MHILNDEPVHVDGLGRAKFASALATVAAECDTPLVIGLYGTWGIGKTSLMKQIETLLADTLNVRSVWFDPWQHQFDEDPAVALLHTMVTQLGLGNEAKKLLFVIAAALGSVFLKASTTVNVDDIQKIGERYEQERFELREKQVRLKEYFGELIQKATEDGRHRIVFFIDDLDRCVPEQVLKVLEALKLYLALPNCVYIMGVDRAALECSIRQRYKEQEVREADYLDKIVQLPFTIPPVGERPMMRFIEPLLAGPLAESAKVLIAGLGDNPRQIKRFVNTLKLNHELAQDAFGKNYVPTVLAAILVIQYRKPELFKLAARDPGVLIELAKGEKSGLLYEDHIKNDPSLAEVIRRAKFRTAEEIAPYIYLSEATGVSNIFNVVLTKPGSNKIALIKVIREQKAGTSLVEAKDLAELAVPAMLATGLDRQRAEAFLSSLKAIGADGELA